MVSQGKGCKIRDARFGIGTGAGFEDSLLDARWVAAEIHTYIPGSASKLQLGSNPLA